MLSVVLGLMVCVVLALVVLAFVALPARREGRDVLSERGEEVVVSLRERADAGRLRRERPGPGGSGERADAAGPGGVTDRDESLTQRR